MRRSHGNRTIEHMYDSGEPTGAEGTTTRVGGHAARAEGHATRAEGHTASVGGHAASVDDRAAAEPATAEPTTAEHATAQPHVLLLARVAALSDDDLVEESVRMAAALSAAQAELAAVLAELERRRVHGQWDCPSIERFAGWKCQLAPARATALSVLGRAMTELPTLGATVVSGELSVDKAVAIARVATPLSEAALVDLARHATVDQTRRICAAWRRYDAPSGDETSEATIDERAARVADEAAIGRVIVIHDTDGVELRARFDHVNGALVLAALDAVTASVRAERRDAEPMEPRRRSPMARPASVDEVPAEGLDREQWRAQGLLRAFELAGSSLPTTTTRTGFRAEVVVHVPVDLLLDPSDVDQPGIASETASAPGPTSQMEPAVLEPRGVGLRRELARLLVCDAGLHTVLEDTNGDPLHMGRRHTSISEAQRRAVHTRDRHCTWPGCAATTVQLHHRHHRVAGGHDDIENLVALCAHHHGVVHRRSIVIGRQPDGGLRFIRRDGSCIGSHDPFARAARGTTGASRAPVIPTLLERQRSLGIDVDSPLRRSQWMNDRFDLGDAIAAVADRRDAALRRTRPTGPPSGVRRE